MASKLRGHQAMRSARERVEAGGPRAKRLRGGSDLAYVVSQLLSKEETSEQRPDRAKGVSQADTEDRGHKKDKARRHPRASLSRVGAELWEGREGNVGRGGGCGGGGGEAQR